LAIHGHQFDSFVASGVFPDKVGQLFYLYLQKIDFKRNGLPLPWTASTPDVAVVRAGSNTGRSATQNLAKLSAFFAGTR